MSQSFGRPAESVRNLTTVGGLLLLDIAANELTAYNDSARTLWELVQEDRADNDPVARFAAHYGIPREIARADVGRIVQQWRSRGLLVDSGTVARTSPPEQKAPTERTLAPPSNWAGTMTCRIQSSVFTFAAETPAAQQFFQIYFKHLETADAPADLHIALRAGENGEGMLVVDGIERHRTSDDALLVGAVHQTILQHIHPDSEWMAMMHGGAVARHDKAIVLPAPSGSGKTTLIAYLVSRGYDYLADDLVALSSDGCVTPWPLPLSVKAGSWPILSGLYRDWPSLPSHETARGPVRLIVPRRKVWDRAATPVEALVFPHFARGAAVELTRLAAFEAFQRLLADRIWLGYPITEERVRAMFAWLDGKPAYYLAYGDLADAARCIEDIV